MRASTLLPWTPAALAVTLAAAGVGLCTAGPDVLLIGPAGAPDAIQAGMLLVLAAAACGFVALVQVAVLAHRIPWRVLRVIARVLSTLLLLAAFPVGYVLLVAAAFTTVNAYRPLDVPGHRVVVMTTTWHHRSIRLLEGDGWRFHYVPPCAGPLPVDGYDPFAAGRYRLDTAGGRNVLRFAEGPGGPYSGSAVLGRRSGEGGGRLPAACG
ncbi:hypothetical protein P5G50_00100 [Leifsonia sp. F6_8S_P_1B]|uniref:Uncharacterized protein n=1 Tax=Leifsonia williamsii TaxID=3035919 RepID=A0ABT8K5W1_9MICO|nr:hypothetical protein [Leifsonia williamsii]MDN4612834.1 hypothetical protein [Leifsonia williamsii]